MPNYRPIIGLCTTGKAQRQPSPATTRRLFVVGPRRFLTICDVQECPIPQNEVVEVAHPVLEKDASTLHTPRTRFGDMWCKGVKHRVQDVAPLSWLAASDQQTNA